VRLLRPFAIPTLAQHSAHDLHESKSTLGLGRRDEVRDGDQRTHGPSSPPSATAAASKGGAARRIAASPVDPCCPPCGLPHWVVAQSRDALACQPKLHAVSP